MAHQQKTHRGQPTAKSQIEQLLNEGDARSDGELAAEVGCSPHTVETYRRDWLRSVSQKVTDLPAEIEIEILALGSEGLAVNEIVEVLFEELGTELSSAEVRGILNQVQNPYPRCAQISDSDLPVITVSGRLMLRLPSSPPNPRTRKAEDACSVCEHQEFCRANWAQHLLACEWPLESEVLMRRSDLEDLLNGSR